MRKMAVIYWSMTGNTEAMANAVAEGAAEAGAEVEVKQVADSTPDEALGYDLLALGCPAMGAELLEEGEFDPFFTRLEEHLKGKKLALFGSYDWGDGQWMRGLGPKSHKGRRRCISGGGADLESDSG